MKTWQHVYSFANAHPACTRIQEQILNRKTLGNKGIHQITDGLGGRNTTKIFDGFRSRCMIQLLQQVPSFSETMMTLQRN